MREYPWAGTPLGPVAQWPQSLRTAVSIMLESRFAMVVAWGPEFRFFYNDRYTPILGTKHPMALAMPGAEIFPEIWPVIGPEFERVRHGAAIAVDDWLLPLDRNGYLENCWFTLSYSPIRDETGGIGGLLAVVAETTGRVEGERRLDTLRDLARQAADAKASEPACTNAVAVLERNPTDVPFATLYLLEDDIARRVCFTGLAADHPANPEVIQLSVSDAKTWPLQRAARSGELELVRDLPRRFGPMPGGSCPEPTHTAVVLPLSRPQLERPYGFLIAGVSPRRAFDEKYKSFFDLAADHIVTAISNARAYQEAQERAESLAELDRAKTTFFSNVSHEFRTPLTLMLGPLEDVLRGELGALDGAQQESLELVQRNGLRLLKLVNTLLDFARIEAGRAEAAYEPTDLAGVTADLAGTFRSAVERAGLRLRVDCPPLPEPVHVDREMWEKVVLNLVSNAFKFTFEGEIAVSLTWHGEHVELAVSDTGTGIPGHELPRIFDRFHRVQGARSRTHEGTGIGLALVQELVRMHGGAIRAESEHGKGSTFTVTVKAGTAHIPAEKLRASRTLSSTAVPVDAFVEESVRWGAAAGTTTGDVPIDGPSRARILIADDNADMRDYLTRLLDTHWSVEVAANGAVALAAAKARAPDLVLSDVMMPEMDGFELLRALREDENTRLIPVVLLSARAGEEARIKGLDVGADDYVIKPFSARELVARIGSQLTLARMRRVEEQRRAELYQLFMQAPTPICVFRGESLVFEMANPLYHRVTGRAALTGKTLREAMPTLHEQGFDELLRQVMHSGKPHVAQETLVRLDRAGDGHVEDTYWTFTYSPLANADGTIERAMVFCSDVTEQVEARRQAEAASRAKDEFLATLSHELRSPLNSIVGWTHILRTRPDEATTERAIETINRNVMAQSQLIADILDVQRLSSGKLRLSLQDVSVATIIEAAVDIVRPAAQAKDIRLTPVLDTEVAPINADADRLQQVVWNLLSNAIKFTPRGGRVQVRLMRIQSHVEIVVEDSGPGINAEFLPHIFERFRQGDSSSTRRHGGVGLGLSIVRNLVELHGGTVHAANNPDGGAVFTVKLPRTSVAPSASHVLVERRSPTAEKDVWLESAPALHGTRVLVIDDQPDAREIVAAVLARCGADVLVATSATEGLALLARERPNVIVCDVEMPEQDGYEFIRNVRMLPRAQGGMTPAAALTAYASTEDRMKALSAGFQIHIPKPVQPAELATVVASLAATARAQDSSQP